MTLVLVGINHKTANIAIREKVAFPPDIVGDALAQIREIPDLDEIVLLSTCNRTEFYVSYESENSLGSSSNGLDSPQLVSEIQQDIVSWLADYHHLSLEEFSGSVYFFSDLDVVRHLMKVSCGLDSMVLGEPQILGQIKSAFALSKDLNFIGPSLDRAFQVAFSIAKQVRTDTAIGENPVSVAYAAVLLAEQIFSDLNSLSIMLIGAGRTIELVARHFSDRGVLRITVANRTLDNALEIASKFDGHGVLLSDIPEQLQFMDIVISSTNSQLPLLGKGAVERALKQRKHNPMLLIDLAVPRDIESEVGDIADAYLYSVDDISMAIEDNVKSRAEAAVQAESIIERAVEEYLKKMLSLNIVETLRKFRNKAEKVREQELKRALKGLNQGASAEVILESLARTITNKLIHTPSVQMKKASAEGREELLQLVQELYELGDDSKN